MSQRKKPGHERREKPLSREAQLRTTVGLIVAGYRHPEIGPGRSTQGIRETVLSATKEAVTSARRPKTKVRNLAGPGEPPDVHVMVNIDHVLALAAQQWGEMDDFKAERFYEIVEGCVDRWLALPDLSGSTEESRRIIAGDF